MNTATLSRLEARVSPDVYALIRRAAQMQGRSITDFVVSVAQRAAQDTIASSEVIRLSVADQAAFAQALMQPAPPPNAAMLKALEMHKRLVKTDIGPILAHE
jgi:uncharacterized protein (DUF1778 family)